MAIILYPERMIYEDLLFTDMMRFYRVSVTGEPGHEYLLVDKNAHYEAPPGYERIDDGHTEKYLLYRKRPR